jgi:acyl dehydratase
MSAEFSQADVSTIAVGDELPPLALPPISRTTLALFAGASGDHNPIHIDLDVAKSAGLDDVFAHGMLSMAYLGRLVTNWIDQASLRSFEVRFSAITPIHGQPTCNGAVTSIETVVSSDNPGGTRLATIALTVALADGTITLAGDAVVELN